MCRQICLKTWGILNKNWGMPSFLVCKGISTASQTVLCEWQMDFNKLIFSQCMRQGSVNISALQMDTLSARGQKPQLQKIRKAELTLLELC